MGTRIPIHEFALNYCQPAANVLVQLSLLPTLNSARSLLTSGTETMGGPDPACRLCSILAQLRTSLRTGTTIRTPRISHHTLNQSTLNLIYDTLNSMLYPINISQTSYGTKCSLWQEQKKRLLLLPTNAESQFNIWSAFHAVLDSHD